jgi:hypothetical protein
VTHPLLTGENRRLLEAAISDAVGEQVGKALDTYLSREPREDTTAEHATARIMEAVATFHADDLAHAEADLPALLDDALGGVMDEPAALLAVEDVIRSDRGAHAAAADRLAGAIREAVALPATQREARVEELLAAERQRLKRRDRTRVRRAVGNLKASLRLPDEAFDTPPSRRGGELLEVA